MNKMVIEDEKEKIYSITSNIYIDCWKWMYTEKSLFHK